MRATLPGTWALVLTLSLEYLAACGSPSKAIDACSLLTKEELEAAVGWQVTEITPGTIPGMDGSCGFFGKIDQKSVPALAKAIVEQNASIGYWQRDRSFKTSAEMAQALSNQQGLDGPPAPVEDLGVPAVRMNMFGVTSIHMSTPRLLVVVTTPKAEATKTIAAKVLARLS